MSWDAWVLVFFIGMCTAIVAFCLIEDIRNAGRYNDSNESVRIRLDDGRWIDAPRLGHESGRHRGNCVRS